MELRKKTPVSYASLFEGPLSDLEETGSGQESESTRKNKGKSRTIPAESEEESDEYQPVDELPEDPSPPPSDADAEEEKEVEVENEEPTTKDDRFEDDSTPRKAFVGGGANSKAFRKMLRRTPSPPPDAPKRVQLERLAPFVNKVTSSTHQAKFSTRFRAVSLYFPLTTRRLASEPEAYGFGGWGTEVPTRCSGETGPLKRLMTAETKMNSGPRWETLEDRGWFRESTETDARPRVWEEVRIQRKCLKILSQEEAAPYLPSSSVLSENGASLPPPPLSCYFGRFGEQQKRTMNMLDSFPMSEYIPSSNAHILNAGGPVHGLSWCPVHPFDFPDNTPLTHWLAVSTFASALDQPTIGQRCEIGAEKGCIQIWSVEKEGAKCEIVLCLEDGPAWQIEWCPLPANDVKGSLRKMGLLAGCFRSGHVCIYAVPYPETIRQLQGKAKGKGKVVAVEGEPVHVQLQPIVRLSVDDAGCVCFDWANSGLIASGSVAVFDIASIFQNLDNPDPVLRLPTHYLPMHQTCVCSVAWVRAPPQGIDGRLQLQGNPTLLASTAYDGQKVLVDIRDGVTSVLERMRDWGTAVKFSTFSGGPIFVEQDYRIKHISLATVNLGRGTMLMDATGPIWDLTTSDFHHGIAVASADGAVHYGTSGRQHSKTAPRIVQPLYQIDYSRNSGELRMLEQLQPREPRQTEETYAMNKKKRESRKTKVPSEGVTDGVEIPPTSDGAEDRITQATGAWSPEVSIYRVSWCNGAGMARAQMLASGGASGLVRIDWVRGTWEKGIMPWRKVEILRGEVDGVDDDVEKQAAEDAEDDD
ncbi:hypothetical protein DACRYDRAFT_109912 [Dacryopinax primogenitus]|uniref:WD40 repeat-like protein n=1 Tax=Dacryopinax primogenitus (strain DJM 731) TaxID=1858805 RepID=M5G619_DACPD|nr:uncharacterized protein DACRYDRAFT_109912 [Dacryopinax primogenitus]EJT99187.1 hypothetical protein DACRYDRAFT_109912 [Dacryopinax primogenitus]